MSLDDGTNVQYQRIRATTISEFPFYPLHFIWKTYRRRHAVCKQQDLDFHDYLLSSQG